MWLTMAIDFFFLVMKSASIISFVGKLHGQLEKRETVNFL